MAVRDQIVRRSAFAIVPLAVALTALGAAQTSYTAHAPIAITACGQSADAVTVSQLSTRAHLAHVFDRMLTARRLAEFRTLVIVIGGSVQGPGDQGADQRRELARIRALLGRARELAVGVIAVHMGGESRRGAASDRLIEAVIAQADYLIVTEAGNQDGLFTRAARARTVPLVIVDEPADVARELRAVATSQ